LVESSEWGIFAAIAAAAELARLLRFDAKNRIPGAYKVIFMEQDSLDRMTAGVCSGCADVAARMVG
jgi:hypothetical protein